MTTTRHHQPSKRADEIVAMGDVFSLDLAREIVDHVGTPPSIEEVDFHPEVDAAADQMIYAQLARSLNDAAQWWGFYEYDQTRANAAMRASLARQVTAASDKLLRSMCGPNGDLWDSLGPGALWMQAAKDGSESGRDAVAAALDGVRSIRAWASLMAERESKRLPSPSSSAGRRPDQAFNKFLATLGSIYMTFWGDAPRLSRDSQRGGKPGGPLFRFASAVLYELDDYRSDEAIATAIRQNAALRGLRLMGK